MSELYDKEGNAIEAFTQEEVEEQKQAIINEAVENYKNEHPENTDVTKIQEELTKARKDLEDFAQTDKGKNVAALREAKETAEEKIAVLEKKLGDEIGGIKKLIEIKDLKNTIALLADNDVELGKKIEFHYNKNVKSEDNEEERRKKLGDAFVLSTGGKNTDVLSKVLGSGGAPNLKAAQPVAGFSPELVALGGKLGITQKDIETYSKK